MLRLTVGTRFIVSTVKVVAEPVRVCITSLFSLPVTRTSLSWLSSVSLTLSVSVSPRERERF